MNTNQCQCHKEPCICGTGLCNQRSFSDSARIETIDKDGHIHYVESIYQKISLKIFENMECCVPNTNVPPIIPPDTESLESRGDSNLNPSIKEEEKEDSNDCIECCEHMYSTSVPDAIHDCKSECNITAELYCQIKRQNSEPGDKISDCSISTSSSDSDDEEIIGEGSAEYVTAQGRSEDIEYNSEATLADEDSFDPSSVPHSTQIEEANERIQCQNKICCPLNSQQKCQHHKSKLNAPDEITNEFAKSKTDKTTNQNISGDSDKQSNLNKANSERQPREKEVMSNDTIEVFNENTSNETKWTTIQPESRDKKTKKPIHKEKTEADKNKNSVEITEITRSASALNIIDFDNQYISSVPPVLPANKEDANWKINTNTKLQNNPDDTAWKTIVPENKEKFSGQSWKRQNVGSSDQSDVGKAPKSTKHVSMPKDLKEDVPTETDIHYIVNNRKRKFGSIPNEFADTSVRFDRDSGQEDDFFNIRHTRRSLSGRKKRVTLSNFVTEEQLKKEEEELVVPDATILSKTVLKPEQTDAFFLLDKSIGDENKRPWSSYIPCERSDFSIIPEDSATKKAKQILNTEDLPKKPMTLIKRDPRQSFIRQKVTPFSPAKFLCFKYVPKITPKTSSTSTLEQNVIDQIALDPPDSFPPAIDIPRAKIPNSRIPVAQFKYKTERKPSSEFETSSSSEAEPFRRNTIGIDELRNVMVQKNPNYRRSIIPPELRKSIARKSIMSKKNIITEEIILQAAAAAAAAAAGQPLDNEGYTQRKKQVVLLDHTDDGSDTSLRNKMKNYYSEHDQSPPPLAAPIKFATSTPVKKIKDPVNLWQQQETVKQEKKPEPTRKNEKVPISATTSNKPVGKIYNGLQKTCCSQTGIHVCVKESVVSEKGKEESNILQMVNIDVTPKNSKFVKVNVMPTVPEVNKEGIITIPVQFKLCTEICKDEMRRGIPEESVEIIISTSNIKSKEDFLYQENPENNWHEHYMEQFIMEDPQKIQGEPYVNLLWTKMKNSLEEPNKEENQNAGFDSVEIQTDLVLGKKLLSKSLSSLTSNDSSSTMQNKSEPVKKSGIDWNDILLPQPGTFVIKKMSPRKAKRRYSGDASKLKDNNIPSTSGGLPPTEEVKTKKDPESESAYSKSKLKCCCSQGKSHEQPYQPANQKSSEEKVTTEELLHSEEEPKDTRSKVISLVFSESFYDTDNYSTSLQQTLPEEEKLISPCTSKPELPWRNILLPTKPQIRKIEKIDISKTSTTITDQTFTDEYNSMSPSPKNTDTCPNLSENSTHTCDCNKNFNDKGTNTSTETDCEAVPYSRKSNDSSNTSSNSTVILKAFKEDPVLSAFKAFEEELKPVRKALAEVQSKLRALNIPELECIFKKDPISEYPISRSSSQIGQNWEYKKPTAPYIGKWSPNSRKPSRCFCQGLSEQFDYQRKHDDFRVFRFATPPLPARSRNLSTDIWKSFGSCDRNTIKCPYEKFRKPPNLRTMRNVESYNYPPYSSARHESRNTTPGPELQYMPFNPIGTKTYNEQRNCPYFHNTFDKRVDMINDDEDLDYPSTYRNTPTHPHLYTQPDCYCDSEDSLYSNTTERVNSNHVLANFPPKYTSSFHIPTTQDNKKYMHVKVRPATHYYFSDAERHGLQNPRHISTRNTSINLKNGKVYARTKIELPRAAYKRVNNMQKSLKKIYPQPNERNYCQSDYDGFQYNRQPYDCTCDYSSIDDNLPIFSNCYNEYSKNERYA